MMMRMKISAERVRKAKHVRARECVQWKARADKKLLHCSLAVRTCNRS